MRIIGVALMIFQLLFQGAREHGQDLVASFSHSHDACRGVFDKQMVEGEIFGREGLNSR